MCDCIVCNFQRLSNYFFFKSITVIITAGAFERKSKLIFCLFCDQHEAVFMLIKLERGLAVALLAFPIPLNTFLGSQLCLGW